MIKRGIFKANDIRGITEGSDPEWDAAGAYAIGAAAVDVLDLQTARALVVGRDMRISGPRMAGAFINGVLSRGVDVIDIGLSSTDQLWFGSGWLDLPGAMFTASHNPAEYNGIKFCLAGAKPITSADLIKSPSAPPEQSPSQQRPVARVLSKTCCPRTLPTCTPLSTWAASGGCG
jgi:phosphomannomutase